ncbi:glycosyltransferase 87 family protein [Curtobacterium ammoniigenes]|uniref:glycosyltransferase 87 family protein n=1 Tax=Curtobacterium ammoniigenes TaxID=395387 RepID=UPI00082B9A33|nr:glycosyltransferase 87 family protein [Curtobacterium ammoniigenes]
MQVVSRGLRPRQERFLAGSAFAFVHLVLVAFAAIAPNLPVGDVSILYRQWMEAGRTSGTWIGLSEPSVYPIVAVLPMLIASIGGIAHFTLSWLVLMTVLDGVAMLLLWRSRALGVRVVWWWLAFLLLLGPIGIGRIDAVATAVAMVGVVFATARPAVASALFTIGAWVKVWPAALVAALLVRARHRLGVIIGAVTVTAVVVAIDLVLGGGAYLLSFVSKQAGRGLQIESALATPFMWAAALHLPTERVFYDHTILAYEVEGHGTGYAANVSTPLMIALVALIVVLTTIAVRRRFATERIAPVAALALVLTLIVANKVGSPQYVGWLAVPIVWGLISGRESALRFRLPAVLALATALLTQLIYPWFYGAVLGTAPAILLVLSARNVLEAIMLVGALVELVRMARYRTAPTSARESAHAADTAPASLSPKDRTAGTMDA